MNAGEKHACNDPAHVIVVSIGTAGDLYPLLSVALALQRRAHRVTFLASANHADVVLQAGLHFHATGTREEYLAAVNDGDLWNPRKGFGVLWRHLRHGLDRVSEFVAALPANERCILVAHPLALPGAGLVRAARPDVRIVAAHLAPALLRNCDDPLTVGPLRIPKWVPMAWRRWIWRRVS